MENSTTDTLPKPNRGFIGRHVDYWSKIDCIESELSGYAMKYPKPIELDDALGIGTNYTFDLFYKLRKSLNKSK
jgi:hypothetical protein